jgi:hypothetical protein
MALAILASASCSVRALDDRTGTVDVSRHSKLAAIQAAHQVGQFRRFVGGAPERAREKDLDAGLAHHVGGVHQGLQHAGLGRAIDAEVHRLQTIEHQVMDCEQRRREHDRSPVAIDEQQAQQHEDPEMEFDRPPAELDVQRDERDIADGQYPACRHATARQSEDRQPGEQHRPAHCERQGQRGVVPADGHRGEA